jgi:cytoskeletal protein CcmA (bactofilin family)
MLKSKTTSKSTTSSGHSPSVNIISEGTSMKGNLNTDSDVRISGEIQGEVRSKGKIIITGTGRLTGNIMSADADISGKIEGEVRVSGKLSLREKSIINGDIYTKTLIVEEGAQINGSCKMGNDIHKLSDSEDTQFSKDSTVKNIS